MAKILRKVRFEIDLNEIKDKDFISELRKRLRISDNFCINLMEKEGIMQQLTELVSDNMLIENIKIRIKEDKGIVEKILEKKFKENSE
jgi:hypothetical protein